MIKYLIDTNVAIYAMAERNSSLTDRMAQCAPGEIAISAISFAELALGSHSGRPPPPELLDAFLSVIPLLPFDEAAARSYSQLPFRRARFDRLLAAHALSIGAAVITNNESDFDDVAGLKVENWTRP